MLKYYSIAVTLILTMGTRSVFALDALDTAHLLGRTGFGLASSTWSDYKNLNRDEAVDFLLGQQDTRSTIDEPTFVDSDIYQRLYSGKLSKAEKKKLRKNDVKDHRWKLAVWWWSEMLSTKSTLHERMVLFWHSHFTSDVRKTHAPFIYEQNQIFRKHGLGDYRVLLREVISGPAMQLFLDNTRNRKGKPNENLARELLELFTLGVGNYTEDDVQEVARALTGWKISKDRKATLFKTRYHDSGVKTILGKTGGWDMQDVLNILLESPKTFEFLTSKLWREFVSPKPDRAEVLRLSRLFQQSDYSIVELVRALLKSDAFWAEKNRMALVKSPVELAVGAIRDYSIPIKTLKPTIKKVTDCGQKLFYPPDVKGWRGHTAWLSTDTIVQRQALLENLLKRKKREFKRGVEKVDLEISSIISNDMRYFDRLMQNENRSRSQNSFQKLEKVLMNDFYQFK